MISLIDLDPDFLDEANRFSILAAHLAVAAEQLQDMDGEAGARLDALAGRTRSRAREAAMDAVLLPNMGLIPALVEHVTRCVAGELMRDAYAAARAGGVR